MFEINTKNITLREILKGLTPQKMQSVGFMQVIPLTSTLTDERFVSPNEGEFSTSDYGTMIFENPTEQLMIVPLHAGYITTQKAQDHAMAHLGLVGKHKTKTFATAMCVQQTQGGYVAKGKYPLLILPFSLRESALNVRHEQNFQKLWQRISDFNVGLGLKNQGHLEYFFKQFAKQLDQFVAEFECVPNQVGAIILINGYIVGIERTPSARYWKSIWQALIRECYGALAIEYTQKYKGLKINDLRQAISGEIKTLTDLMQALDQAEAEEEAQVHTIIRDSLTEILTLEKESESLADLKVFTITNENFTGQIIQDGEATVYASIFAKENLIKKQVWSAQKDFEI